MEATLNPPAYCRLRDLIRAVLPERVATLEAQLAPGGDRSKLTATDRDMIRLKSVAQIYRENSDLHLEVIEEANGGRDSEAMESYRRNHHQKSN